MPKESIIRIHRSDTAAAVPSLTAGEIAINLADKKLFVGNSTGGVVPFYGDGVSGINGITGAVSITSGSNITITQSDKTLTIASSGGGSSPPLATSSVTGVASFRAADFDVSITGSVSLTGTVARTNTSQTFTGLQVFSSGLSSNGITGTILTPSQPNITSVGTLISLNTAGLTSTQRVTISSGGLSVAGNIDGTIGTAAQPNITSLGSLTTLTTAGLTSTQRINVSSGGIVVQAGGLSVTGGANLTGGSTFFGDIEVYDGAFIRTGGLSVTGGIAGTLVTPAQTNITSLGTLTSLTTSGLLSAQALDVVSGATFGIDIYAPNMVTGVNGITGAVSITSGSNVTITQTGKTITIASSGGGGSPPPLATSSITGVASFRAADFDVSTTGSVSLTGTVARTNTSQSFSGMPSFQSGLSSAGATFGGNVNMSGGVLQNVELRDYYETINTPSFANGVLTCDLNSAQVFNHTLASSITGISLQNVPLNANTSIGFTLVIKQSVAGGLTAAFNKIIGATAMFPGGTAPTMSSATNRTDIVSYVTYDNGSNWYGFVGGQAFTL